MTLKALEAQAGKTAYGLTQPTLADTRTAVENVYHGGADEVWTRLRTAARLTGREDDRTAVQSVIEAAYASGDPVLELLGHAQTIRLESFERLLAVRETVLAAVG
jgi:hypothetical protein